MDEARGLVSDQTLWPLVRGFLWDFVPQIHPSWLEGLDVEDRMSAGMGKDFRLSDLLLSREASPRIKRVILEQFGISPCFHAFPKDDWSRLLLLDGSMLESMAKWLGALACADGLRRVTAGATVRELKSTLSGVYPEVFGFTMYFKGFDVFAEDVEGHDVPVSGNGVVSVGCKLLLALLGGVPDPILSRLKFKLPKSLCDLCVLSGNAGARPDQSFVAKLLKLKFTEAYKLCC